MALSLLHFRFVPYLHHHDKSDVISASLGFDTYSSNDELSSCGPPVIHLSIEKKYSAFARLSSS